MGTKLRWTFGVVALCSLLANARAGEAQKVGRPAPKPPAEVPWPSPQDPADRASPPPGSIREEPRRSSFDPKVRNTAELIRARELDYLRTSQGLLKDLLGLRPVSPSYAITVPVASTVAARQLDVSKSQPRNSLPTTGSQEQQVGLSEQFGEVYLLNLPTTVETGREFEFVVALSAPRAAVVEFDEAEGVRVEPVRFELPGNDRKTVKARVSQARAGLGEIVMRVNTANESRHTVNAGFAAKPKLEWLNGSPEAGAARAASFSLVGADGAPAILGGQLQVTLQGVGVELSWDPLTGAAGGAYSRELAFAARRGTSGAATFTVRPLPGIKNAQIIARTFYAANAPVLSEFTVNVAVGEPWWHRLGFSLLGAVLCAVYRHLRTRRWQVRLAAQRLGLALIAGVLAYLVAEWNWLGLDVKASAPRALVIFGFLFAYFGVDTVIAAAIPKLKASKT
jgi:hypothetical protein